VGNSLLFGVFDHLDRGEIPLYDFYEARLRIAEAYDAAGFYSYHVAEHHSTPLGMAPSPGIFLSAVAQRTRRLRFGPAVYLLPLYHPLRLAEEIAMLDQLSEGRLDVGIGRGISPIESSFYGANIAEAEERFNESLAIMRMAFTQPQVNYEGKHYHFHDVPVELKPFQRPYPPSWYGILSTESAERCVERDFNGITLGTPSFAATVVRRYRDAAERAGKPDLKIGVSRFIVVADTDAQALRIGRHAYPHWHHNFHYLYHKAGRSPVHGERPPDFDTALEAGLAVAGSPRTVTEALQAQFNEIGANYILGQFAFGDISVDESLNSIGLFAAHVMPALKAGLELPV
jgi:alkanesulfonate monooxygenase SsuD/methylene tetrahydromethanopterin reductase-like flavin-dependent oxidoreductase (luciferase family)